MVLILWKWKPGYWYWNWDCRALFGSIDIEIDIEEIRDRVLILKLRLHKQFWRYWYCVREKPKLSQYFVKAYVVNIAIILRLNHKYCRKFSIEKILKHVFHCNWYWNWDWNCRNIFSEIEIEIEIEEISSQVLKLRLRLQLKCGENWDWNWYRGISPQILILKQYQKFQYCTGLVDTVQQYRQKTILSDNKYFRH